MKPFPLIIVQTKNIPEGLSAIDELIQSGGLPTAVLFLKGLIPLYQDIAAVQKIECKLETLERTLADVLLTLRGSLFEADWFVVCRNDSGLPLSAISLEIQLAESAPKTIHFLEITPDAESDLGFPSWRKRLQKWIQRPDPALWVIPAAALQLIPEKGLAKKMFPLSWLLQLERKHAEIQLVRIDTLSGARQLSDAFTRPHLWFYMVNLFLRYAVSAFLSLLIDNLVFFLLVLWNVPVSLALIGGRTASMMVNYALLRNVVFNESGSGLSSFFRYLGLVCFSGSVIWFTIRAVTTLTPVHPLTVKIAAETVMFFFNYFAAKRFVFRRKP